MDRWLDDVHPVSQLGVAHEGLDQFRDAIENDFAEHHDVGHYARTLGW